MGGGGGRGEGRPREKQRTYINHYTSFCEHFQFSVSKL